MLFFPTLFNLTSKDGNIRTFPILSTISPLTTIPDAPDLLVKTHGARSSNTELLITNEILPQKGQAAELLGITGPLFVLVDLTTGAVVEGVEVDAVFQGTVLDEAALGDLFVRGY